MYEKVVEAEETSAKALTVSRGGANRQGDVLRLKLQSLIAEEMGKPYKWGGTGPDGYDCSGLVYALYKKLGITLPRTSRGQAGAGTYVEKENLVYGDIVLLPGMGRT